MGLPWTALDGAWRSLDGPFCESRVCVEKREKLVFFGDKAQRAKAFQVGLSRNDSGKGRQKLVRDAREGRLCASSSLPGDVLGCSWTVRHTNSAAAEWPRSCRK